MASKPTSIRVLSAGDQEQLWNWLHVALWDPPPAGLRPREVLSDPEVRVYVEDWGKPGDVGFVAVQDGEDVGACWLRLLPDGVGLASIDAETPQLGIAVLPGFQRQGHGARLMRAALKAASEAGYCQISLTVHPENPAVTLYERFGFVKREVRNAYHLMVRTGLASFKEL